MTRNSALSRLLLALSALLAFSACTGSNVNAGRQGGVAFIIFTVVLVLGCAILWFIIGRE